MSGATDVAAGALEFAKEAKFCRVISVLCLIGLVACGFLVCTTIMQGNQVLAVLQEQLRDVKQYQQRFNDLLMQQQATLQQGLNVQMEMLKEMQKK